MKNLTGEQIFCLEERGYYRLLSLARVMLTLEDAKQEYLDEIKSILEPIGELPQ